MNIGGLKNIIFPFLYLDKNQEHFTNENPYFAPTLQIIISFIALAIALKRNYKHNANLMYIILISIISFVFSTLYILYIIFETGYKTYNTYIKTIYIPKNKLIQININNKIQKLYSNLFSLTHFNSINIEEYNQVSLLKCEYIETLKEIQLLANTNFREKSYNFLYNSTNSIFGLNFDITDIIQCHNSFYKINDKYNSNNELIKTQYESTKEYKKLIGSRIKSYTFAPVPEQDLYISKDKIKNICINKLSNNAFVLWVYLINYFDILYNHINTSKNIIKYYPFTFGNIIFNYDTNIEIINDCIKKLKIYIYTVFYGNKYTNYIIIYLRLIIKELNSIYYLTYLNSTDKDADTDKYNLNYINYIELIKIYKYIYEKTINCINIRKISKKVTKYLKKYCESDHNLRQKLFNYYNNFGSTNNNIFGENDNDTTPYPLPQSVDFTKNDKNILYYSILSQNNIYNYIHLPIKDQYNIYISDIILNILKYLNYTNGKITLYNFTFTKNNFIYHDIEELNNISIYFNKTYKKSTVLNNYLNYNRNKCIEFIDILITLDAFLTKYKDIYDEICVSGKDILNIIESNSLRVDLEELNTVTYSIINIKNIYELIIKYINNLIPIKFENKPQELSTAILLITDDNFFNTNQLNLSNLSNLSLSSEDKSKIYSFLDLLKNNKKNFEGINNIKLNLNDNFKDIYCILYSLINNLLKIKYNKYETVNLITNKIILHSFNKNKLLQDEYIDNIVNIFKDLSITHENIHVNVDVLGSDCDNFIEKYIYLLYYYVNSEKTDIKNIINYLNNSRLYTKTFINEASIFDEINNDIEKIYEIVYGRLKNDQEMLLLNMIDKKYIGEKLDNSREAINIEEHLELCNIKLFDENQIFNKNVDKLIIINDVLDTQEMAFDTNTSSDNLYDKRYGLFEKYKMNTIKFNYDESYSKQILLYNKYKKYLYAKISKYPYYFRYLLNNKLNISSINNTINIDEWYETFLQESKDKYIELNNLFKNFNTSLLNNELDNFVSSGKIIFNIDKIRYINKNKYNLYSFLLSPGIPGGDVKVYFESIKSDPRNKYNEDFKKVLFINFNSNKLVTNNYELLETNNELIIDVDKLKKETDIDSYIYLIKYLLLMKKLKGILYSCDENKYISNKYLDMKLNQYFITNLKSLCNIYTHLYYVAADVYTGYFKSSPNKYVLKSKVSKI